MVWKLVAYVFGSVLAYVAFVSALVACGALLVRLHARLDPQDDDQRMAFERARAGLWLRLWGQCVEGCLTALDLALRFVHALRLLPPIVDQGVGTPVVLLAGYTENVGCMWWIAKRLQRAGFRPFLIDFPSSLAPLEDNVAFLKARIDELCLATGSPRVAIVAHSMGGVVARALMLSHSAHRILSLVAIASPFRGTHLAIWAARLRRGSCAAEMAPGSVFNQRYAHGLATTAPIHSIVGMQENVVSPEWSCVLPGCDTYVLRLPVGHDAPLYLREAFECMVSWLAADGVVRGPACTRQRLL